MLELNTDNLFAFLQSHQRVEPGPTTTIETLAWGVSNVVFRVQTATQLFVVKQARAKLRTKEAWYSDLGRVLREQEAMQQLAPVLPPFAVPRVLWVEPEHYVFAMSHAPISAQVWKERLLAGEVEPRVGTWAGTLLGKLHQATADQPGPASFADKTVFIQLRADPFYRTIQARRPKVAARVADIADEMLACKQAWCHGDFSPKNMLIHAWGITLVDYETVCLGDPTMDLGFFLSHLLLKAYARPEQRDDFFTLTRNFWASYATEVSFCPFAELLKRALGHLGVCLLARLDGTSPVDYLTDPERQQAVRVLADSLLLAPPTAWDEVLARASL